MSPIVENQMSEQQSPEAELEQPVSRPSNCQSPPEAVKSERSVSAVAESLADPENSVAASSRKSHASSKKSKRSALKIDSDESLKMQIAQLVRLEKLEETSAKRRQ